jgi:hypothetical protein
VFLVVVAEALVRWVELATVALVVTVATALTLITPFLFLVG